MISCVFYEIVVNRNKQGRFYSDIKQKVGSDYRAEDVEVTALEGYTGPSNPERFSRGIRNYYEHLLGDGVGAKTGMMRNSTMIMDSEFEFDAAA